MRHFRLKTAAATEPVTVDEVKLYSRVAYSVEDAIIASWIAAARKLAEDYQHRAYISQKWTLTYDSLPGSCILVPRPSLISVESINYYDTDDAETLFDSANYFVDLTSEVGRISLNYGEQWPTVTLRPVNAVIIEYTAGYGVDATFVPDSVKNAIYLYCTHMNENRASEDGTVPVEFYDLLRPDRMAVY